MNQWYIQPDEYVMVTPHIRQPFNIQTNGQADVLPGEIHVGQLIQTINCPSSLTFWAGPEDQSLSMRYSQDLVFYSKVSALSRVTVAPLRFWDNFKNVQWMQILVFKWIKIKLSLRYFSLLISLIWNLTLPINVHVLQWWEFQIKNTQTYSRAPV